MVMMLNFILFSFVRNAQVVSLCEVMSALPRLCALRAGCAPLAGVKSMIILLFVKQIIVY